MQEEGGGEEEEAARKKVRSILMEFHESVEACSLIN